MPKSKNGKKIAKKRTKKRAKKTTSKPTSLVEVGTMPTMPGKNGGTLNRGGTPGNKGGTGRPPNALKNLATEEVIKIIPRMSRIAQGETIMSQIRRKGSDGRPIELEATPEIKDQIKAFGELGKLAKDTSAQIKAAAAGEFDPDGTVRFTLVLGEVHDD